MNWLKKLLPLILADLFKKIKDIKEKISDITNLATAAGLTAVEDKIHYISNLVKKVDYDVKKMIKKKYFTTSDYDRFTIGILDEKITKKLVNESGLDEKIKTLATKEEIKALATNAELKAEQDKVVKLQAYDLILFVGQSYFFNDGSQFYLILQPLYYNLKRLGDTEKVLL